MKAMRRLSAVGYNGGKSATASVCSASIIVTRFAVSGIDSYEKKRVPGARFTIMRPLVRESRLSLPQTRRSKETATAINAIADGPYVGVNASF